jgi:hypothetical protein
VTIILEIHKKVADTNTTGVVVKRISYSPISYLYLVHYLLLITCYYEYLGARGGAVVEALRYKPEGRGIHSRWCH